MPLFLQLTKDTNTRLKQRLRGGTAGAGRRTVKRRACQPWPKATWRQKRKTSFASVAVLTPVTHMQTMYPKLPSLRAALHMPPTPVTQMPPKLKAKMPWLAAALHMLTKGKAPLTKMASLAQMAATNMQVLCRRKTIHALTTLQRNHLLAQSDRLVVGVAGKRRERATEYNALALLLTALDRCVLLAQCHRTAHQT